MKHNLIDILTSPVVPTQQDQVIIKGIKSFNISLVITTQNQKVLKRFLEIPLRTCFCLNFYARKRFWISVKNVVAAALGFLREKKWFWKQRDTFS